MEEDQELLIKAENESLVEGGFVDVLLFDPHWLHIREHVETLKNPIIRRDLEAVDRIIKHIQKHIDIFKEAEDLFYD